MGWPRRSVAAFWNLEDGSLARHRSPRPPSQSGSQNERASLELPPKDQTYFHSRKPRAKSARGFFLGVGSPAHRENLWASVCPAYPSCCSLCHAMFSPTPRRKSGVLSLMGAVCNLGSDRKETRFGVDETDDLLLSRSPLENRAERASRFFQKGSKSLRKMPITDLVLHAYS